MCCLKCTLSRHTYPTSPTSAPRVILIMSSLSAFAFRAYRFMHDAASPVKGRDLAVISVVAITVFYWASSRRRSGSNLPLPPGPQGRFLVGNMNDLPTGPEEWKEFARLGQVHGPVFRLGILDRNIVVLNTPKAAYDLLDKRSAIYSDRPTFPMLTGLVGFDWHLTVQTYGPNWRVHRRAVHQHFHEQATKRLWPQLQLNNTTFLELLLKDPAEWWEHCRWLSGANIMNITYGMKSAMHDDPYIRMGEEALLIGARAAAVGVWLVDVLPILKYIPDWMPGARFKRDAKAWKTTQLRARDLPYEWVKEQMAAGQAPQSMVLNLHDREIDGQPIPETVIRNSAGTVYLAGADTTVCTMHAFFLSIVHNPSFQRVAQAEIDANLGSALPTLDDRPKLPFVEALLRELLRHYPQLPLGVPHRLMQDDVYEGMHIPAGAFVMPNAWAILHDPECYPDPHVFNPFRFLTSDGKINDAVMDPRTSCFGFGRRICPGRYFADHEIWLTIATVLSCFNIQQIGDTLPSDRLSSGFICTIDKFACNVTPRSEEKRMLIMESVAETAVNT